MSSRLEQCPPGWSNVLQAGAMSSSLRRGDFRSRLVELVIESNAAGPLQSQEMGLQIETGGTGCDRMCVAPHCACYVTGCVLPLTVTGCVLPLTVPAVTGCVLPLTVTGCVLPPHCDRLCVAPSL
ncbi:hypothetical protein ACOMHN_012179 [Nucella lapillus]